MKGLLLGLACFGLVLGACREPAPASPTPAPATPTAAPATATPAANFDRSGVLVRDNPGLPPGVWHLVYEEPGAPALTVALEFTDDSVCMSGDGPVSCDDLEPGIRVHIEGAEADGVVRVASLEAEGTTTTAVQVFFLDERRYATGDEPFVVAVERQVQAPAVAAGALDALFQGPTADEEARSLRLAPSGASGARILRLEGGIAHVELLGGCDSMGATFTIAQLIIPTLTQFDTIDFVKIYDLEGTTAEPEGPSNSIPACLEP